MAKVAKITVADGCEVFYREAGPQNAPVLLLLHGFPASSFQYRNLMPLLSQKYRVIAPDLPAFGFTTAPEGYVYTFESFAKTVGAFVDKLGIKKFAMYIFDYGAPTGLRLALQRPEAITAIISQNGNAYEEGLGDAWAPIRALWADPNASNRKTVKDAVLHIEGCKWQHTEGVPAASLPSLDPADWTLEAAVLEQPGSKDRQLDIFYDYRTNVALYPTIQVYFRTHRPPLLAVWGDGDLFFIPPGAEAFKRDLPEAKVKLYKAGHFALDTHVNEIAADVLAFLAPLKLN